MALLRILLSVSLLLLLTFPYILRGNLEEIMPRE